MNNLARLEVRGKKLKGTKIKCPKCKNKLQKSTAEIICGNCSTILIFKNCKTKSFRLSKNRKPRGKKHEEGKFCYFHPN